MVVGLVCFVVCLRLSGLMMGLVFVWFGQGFLGLELLCAVVIALSICLWYVGFGGVGGFGCGWICWFWVLGY